MYFINLIGLASLKPIKLYENPLLMCYLKPKGKRTVILKCFYQYQVQAANIIVYLSQGINSTTKLRTENLLTTANTYNFYITNKFM